MSNYLEEAIIELQTEIDKIKKETPIFFGRLNILLTQPACISLLHSRPPLPKLKEVMDRSGETALNAPNPINITTETYDAMKLELKTLKTEVIQMMKRLSNLINHDVLRDLLTGVGNVLIPNNGVYLWSIYDDFTLAEDIRELNKGECSNWRNNMDSDYSTDEEPIRKNGWD